MPVDGQTTASVLHSARPRRSVVGLQRRNLYNTVEDFKEPDPCMQLDLFG